MSRQAGACQRQAIEQRKLVLVLRDDDHDGAPPRVRVDLAANRFVVAPYLPAGKVTQDPGR